MEIMVIKLFIWICFLVANCSSQDCSTSKVDLVFVVDDSTSVQRANFKKVLVFVQDVVRSLSIGPDDAQVGFVSFSHTVKNQFYFNEFTDNSSLINKIGNIRFRGGNTDITKALNEAYNNHFQDQSKGVRDDAAKVLLLITDGQSRGTEGIAETIRKAGIDILCVGISPSIDLQQLIDISGDATKVFTASSVASLGEIEGRLITKTCEAVEPDVNPCDNSPCQHSGTCVHHGGGDFTCYCNRKYVGKLCEMQINPCDPNPCLNNGICRTISMESFSCECTPEFMGALCNEEVPVQPCEPNPCLNGGSCLESGEDFLCSCKPTFTGQTCETEFSPSACVPSPCRNEANCVESGLTPICVCKEGFGNKNCQMGGVMPTVTEVGGVADISCKISPSALNVVVEVTDVNQQRLERQSSNKLSLKNVEKSDISGTQLCHYISSSANSSTSASLPLIVVEKMTEMSKTSTKYTCTIFTTLKNANVNIKVSVLPLNRTQEPDVYTSRIVDSNGGGDSATQKSAFYTTSEPDNTNVDCSVTYDHKEVWSGRVSIEKEIEPKVKGNGGLPGWVWLLLVIVIVGGITAGIVFIICRKRAKGIGKNRKSTSDPKSEEEGKELKEIGEKQDFNDIEVEDEKKTDEIKDTEPLKPDIHEYTSE